MKSDTVQLNRSLQKDVKGDEFKSSNSFSSIDDSASNSFLENYSGSNEDRENENPDQPRVIKRKNSSSELADNISKILKKESVSESPAFTVTVTASTPTANENVVSVDSVFQYQNVSAKDYFSLLPDEVLLSIFKAIQHKPTLVNCACVCRRWRNVVFDIDLWPRIELSQRRIESGIMEVVLNKKPITLRMFQTKVISPIFRNVDAVAIISKIEYLDLSMASIHPSDLELLLRTCTNLLKLSLEFVDVSEGVCREIAKNSKLSVLNLAQSGQLNETSLKIILTKCSKLSDLNIAWANLNAASIKCICQYVPKNIERLNLSGCVKEMTDSHVSALVLRCNKLKELDLSDATGITDSSIYAICDNLNNLEILSMSRCYNIFPASYSKLFRLPSIAFINIFGLFSESQIETLRKTTDVELNTMKFSYVARPTVGHRRTSIWGMRVRD